MPSLSIPRIVLSSSMSGGGKTSLALGLARAMDAKGGKASLFKVGPDFIDHLFHKLVVGELSSNLDLFFTGREKLRSIFAEKARLSDFAIIEGVMGFYDGLSPKSTTASTYDVANCLRAPVVYIASGKRGAQSLAAEIFGFIKYREDSNIQGIFLSPCTKSQFEYLKDELEASLGIPVLGYLPYDEKFSFEERYLGLNYEPEKSSLFESIDAIAHKLLETTNFDLLTKLASLAAPVEYHDLYSDEKSKSSMRLAIADDKAFRFYYQESLDLIQSYGVELVPFSPLNDAELPPYIDGLYLGGGHPELFVQELSSNTSMRNSIKNVIESGCPTIAECGGFLYLHETMCDHSDQEYEMCGVIKGGSHREETLKNFGYIKLISHDSGLFVNEGDVLKGHEFHYWQSSDPGSGFVARKPLRKKEWPCIHLSQNLFAGFPHLYFHANPEFLEDYIKAMKDYSESRNSCVPCL